MNKCFLALLLALTPMTQRVSAQENCAFADKYSLNPTSGFKCRVMFSGSASPENIFFIDDYDNDRRYMVGSDDLFGTQINNFKYYGGIYGYRGSCMSSPDFPKLVCWGGRKI